MALDFYYEKWQLFPTNTLHLGEVPRHMNCCPSVSDNSFSTLKKSIRGMTPSIYFWTIVLSYLIV